MLVKMRIDATIMNNRLAFERPYNFYWEVNDENRMNREVTEDVVDAMLSYLKVHDTKVVRINDIIRMPA